MRITLATIALALVVWGITDLLRHPAAPDFATYTVEEFLSERPADKRVRITGAYQDVSFATYTGKGRAEEVFIPTTALSDPQGERIELLVATRDKDTRKLMDTMNKIPDAEMLEFMENNSKRLFLKGDITGTVRSGGALEKTDVEKLRELTPQLSRDFIIIDTGGNSRRWWPLLIPGGLVCLAGTMLCGRRKPAGEPA